MLHEILQQVVSRLGKVQKICGVSAVWMEAELRKFFGWRDGSRMPAIYVHLALEDEVEQLKALLRKIVAESSNRTRRS